MPRNTIARIKVNNKNFEIAVDLDYALKLRKGENVNIQNVLLANEIFTNSQNGSKAASADLEAAFETSDVFAVADRIVKKGEIQLPKEYRDEQLEAKKKKVADFFVRNAIDAKTGRPFTPDTISRAMDQAGVNIDNRPVEQQLKAIEEKLKEILPLKFEMKKIAITIPAMHTGKVYGVVNEYKEKEEWLNDGSLKVIVNIPVGLQSEFYDKLNGVTHGSAVTEEVK